MSIRVTLFSIRARAGSLAVCSSAMAMPKAMIGQYERCPTPAIIANGGRQAANASTMSSLRLSSRSAKTPPTSSISSGGISISARLAPSSIASTSKWKTSSHCTR